MKLHAGFFQGNYPSKAQIEAGIDELAEELSRDRFTLNEIADRMQVSRGTICVLFHSLCTRYGEEVRI